MVFDGGLFEFILGDLSLLSVFQKVFACVCAWDWGKDTTGLL